MTISKALEKDSSRMGHDLVFYELSFDQGPNGNTVLDALTHRLGFSLDLGNGPFSERWAYPQLTSHLLIRSADRERRTGETVDKVFQLGMDIGLNFGTALPLRTMSSGRDVRLKIYFGPILEALLNLDGPAIYGHYDWRAGFGVGLDLLVGNREKNFSVGTCVGGFVQFDRPNDKNLTIAIPMLKFNFSL